VLDPGFGRHAPLVPVPLETGQQAADEGELHRMVKSGHVWVLEVRVDGAMLPLWSSSFEPAEPVDFVMGNHFVSTFPESPFVTGLRLHAFAPHGSVSMLNRDMTIRYAGGVEKSVIADRDALHALLAEHFGFDLPDVRRLRVPSVPEWT
jgi:N-hydroxyarylamine O-acetyltransferase